MIYGHIKSASRIGIFTHANPDGDALGSSLGLAGYLGSIGKEWMIFLPDGISENLRFMVLSDLAGRITVWTAGTEDRIREEVSRCDLLVGLDFNTPDRLGGMKGFFTESGAYKILIDHHLNPERESFCEVYSETQISSASELLYHILKDMPEIAGDASKMTSLTRESLLTGMTTDTNNFSNSVYPSTFRMASELIAAGTDRDAIIQKLYFNYPLRHIKSQGYILDSLLEVDPRGVAYYIIDREVQKRFGLKEGDTEGFVNIPLSIDTVKMSIALKQEMEGNKVRVSIRSKKGTSAQNCAVKYFHGGGHENAAGGKLVIGEDIADIKEARAYIEKVIGDFC